MKVLVRKHGTSDEIKVPSSCLDWARNIVFECGIVLGKIGKRKPIEEIHRLNSARIALMPSNFNTASLGRPFSGANTFLRTQMLFSGVILSPSHCSPEECDKWTHQWGIEDTEATDQTIRLLERAAERRGMIALWQLRPSTFLDEEKGIWKRDPYTIQL